MNEPANHRLLAAAYAIALLLALLTAPARSAEPAPMAQQADAVGQVVLGILSYVRWPDEPDTLNLCVIGPTEYADSLLRGLAQANGRRVNVVRRAVDDPQLGDCHAVYLGSLAETERQRIFQRLAGRAVLSIDERNPGCSVGSMFCLHITPPRIAFAVNLDSVARSGVRVHPSVLKLAQRKGTP